MNKLLYKVLRKYFLLSSSKEKPRSVYLGPLKGLKWLYHSGYSEYFMGDYEKQAADAFYAASINRKVVYDLGANIGYYTLIAAKAAGKDAVVYAFEPLPQNVVLLKRNIEANTRFNIKLIEKAVSNVTGKLEFSNSGNNVANTLQKESPLFKESETITVNVVKLDDMVNSREILPPNLIKIDVEGAELDALVGMEELLKKYHPTLFLSTHNCQVEGVHKKCIDFLKKLDYKIEYLDFRANETEFDDPWYEVMAKYEPKKIN